MDNQSMVNGSISQDVNEAKITLYVVLLVLSLFGNLLVILVVLYNQKLITCFNYLFLNMAISDLLIPLFAIPFIISEKAGLKQNEWLVDGILGTILCKLCYFLTDMATAVSIFTLVIVAIERLFAISFSLRVNLLNKKRTFILIASTWIISTAIYSPYFYFRQLVKMGYTVCTSLGPSKMIHFIIITTVIVFIIPCIFITSLYINIIWNIRKKTKEIVKMLDPRQARSRIHRDQQVFRLSIVIICTFYVFWGPFFVYALIVTLVWNFHIPDYVDNATIVFVVDTLGLVNSSINPFIYFLFQKNYQQGMIRIIRRILRKPGPGGTYGNSQLIRGTTRYTSELRNLTQRKQDSPENI